MNIISNIMISPKIYSFIFLLQYALIKVRISKASPIGGKTNPYVNLNVFIIIRFILIFSVLILVEV